MPVHPCLHCRHGSATSSLEYPHVISREERRPVKCRYLFNVGEGFQRFAMQHQIKLNRLTDILLTRNGSEAAGGLPGAGRSALL